MKAIEFKNCINAELVSEFKGEYEVVNVKEVGTHTVLTMRDPVEPISDLVKWAMNRFKYGVSLATLTCGNVIILNNPIDKEESGDEIYEEGVGWCNCDGDTLYGAYYMEDGEHPLVWKHHWRCRDCNEVVQIG